MASSQLVVQVSELHADINNRLEITCLATIPAHVGPGEQFADYKTYSVKSEYRRRDLCSDILWVKGFQCLNDLMIKLTEIITFLMGFIQTVDVEQSELTTTVPQPAKFGNSLSSSSYNLAHNYKLWQKQLIYVGVTIIVSSLGLFNTLNLI